MGNHTNLHTAKEIQTLRLARENAESSECVHGFAGT